MSKLINHNLMQIKWDSAQNVVKNIFIKIKNFVQNVEPNVDIYEEILKHMYYKLWK